MADKPTPRTERLRSALRENLKRRKEQARGRARTKPDAPADVGERRNSARIADDQERES
jgi:hypothetical protein